ncbi:MAG: hypothetical protein ACHQ6U_06680 [Thermodesulfobacteriota bacterium]
MTSLGRSVLGELGIRPDDIETIISSLIAGDYASIHAVGGDIPENVPRGDAAERR